MEFLSKKYKKYPFILLFFFSLGCSNSKKEEEKLAKQFCGSCHVFPEPSLLSKDVWIKNVLPNMATRLGIIMAYPYSNLSPLDIDTLMSLQIVPSEPMLSEEQMLKIVKYYTENAPKNAFKPIKSEMEYLEKFDAEEIILPNINNKNILLKSVKDKIFMSFEEKGSFVFDAKTHKAIHVNNVISSDIGTWQNSHFLFDLTSIQAHNLPKDKILEIKSNSKIPKQILQGITRPVSMDVADVNEDQKPDFIIAEFGDYLGSLSLFLSTKNGYEKQVLRNEPGAVKVYFKDLDTDGKLDIAALMSQGKEQVMFYLNKKEGFEEKVIAVFPSSYGSNYMIFKDLDGDKIEEIILTNGDNADVSSSLKAYHGVRILKKMENLAYKESWLFPFHGASAVEAADFDKDGDLDLAAISHFADFSNPNSPNFIYFENLGSLKFKAQTFKTPLNGRPLTMAVLDIDNDNDQDILIGNHIDYLTEPGKVLEKAWKKHNVSFWIIKNYCQTVKMQLTT
jgi:FG-GAP-like repeat